MRYHRFFTTFDPAATELVLRDRELWHQLKYVLKIKSGEQIILCDGQGAEIIEEIVGYGRGEVKLKRAGAAKLGREANRPVILYCAILKRDNFEWVVQKATEVGVIEIVPLITERTIKSGLQTQRLEKIIKEAAEQSGRLLLPRLFSPLSLASALKQARQNEYNIFFDIAREAAHEADFKGLGPLGLFIGPEGGWSDNERKQAQEQDVPIRTLGPLTMRAETAAVVAGFLGANN